MDSNQPSSPENSEKMSDYTSTIAQQLGTFIEGKSATFACGGAVATGNDAKAVDVAQAPVILRWDAPQAQASTSRLTFPLDLKDDAGARALAQLMDACQPASFGHNGEAVLDDSYRKAAKMDRSAFCVDFCPYETGIIDTVAQMLLPNSNGYAGNNGVRAELYKLNIYTAPSGFFKSHVDTPRSSAQFGSLVVSLPCYHKGGQLVVRHAGNSHTFDWGSDDEEGFSSSIRWAAFYSDCEHEVLEVTSGHRITLTYNLYHSPGVGHLTENSQTLDMKSIPLFHHVQDALKKSDFMPNGGLLGIYCHHAYAHAYSGNARAFPSILKGSDMAVYTVFKALDLDVQVRAILDTKTDDFRYYFEWEEENRPEAWPPVFYNHNVVRDLGGRGLVDVVHDEGMDELVYAWSRDFRMVNWVNKPRFREADMIHATYGNEPGVDALYSHAAMLVKVPPASERGVPGSAE